MSLRGKPAVSALLLLTAIFYLNFFARILFSPLLPSIEESLTLSHGKAGSLFLVISTGYFISLVGSGFVSARLGHKNSIVASMLFISGSLFLIAALPAFSQLLPAFFLLGLGAGIYLPSAIATISELFSHAHWGKVFAVHELAPNLAFLTAPICSSLLLPIFHWRHVVLILAFTALAAGIMYHFSDRGRNSFGKRPDVSLCRYILRQKDFLILVALFALGIAGTIGIFNILPLFLVTSHSLSPQDANLLVGLSRLLPLGSALLGGWLADRFGNRGTIASVLVLTGLATCGIGLAEGVFLTIAIFLQPVLAVCFFPAGFALLSRLTDPSARNVVISLAIPLSFFAGGGCLPSLIALMADAGLFHAGIVLTGIFISSSALLVFLIGDRLPLPRREAETP